MCLKSLVKAPSGREASKRYLNLCGTVLRAWSALAEAHGSTVTLDGDFAKDVEAAIEMNALEKASIGEDVGPFADFLTGLVKKGLAGEPLPEVPTASS